VKLVTIKGKHSTRDIILHTLKSSHHITVDDLADAADVSPVTVRHHLNSLQADNLIEVDSVRRKVGRPYYVYSLSEKGHELFPKKYIRLTNRLLDELKTHLPPEAMSDLFTGLVENILDEHKGEFENLSFEARLTYLVELLAEEGFLANWKKVEDEYQLIEYSCPYISVGHKHDEICTFDKALMTSILQTQVEQHSCMLHGDECCQFTVSAETEVSEAIDSQGQGK
jgi:predicted ArsR family transcriptional regulator